MRAREAGVSEARVIRRRGRNQGHSASLASESSPPRHEGVRKETGQKSKARNVWYPRVERKGRTVEPTEKQKVKRQPKEQEEQQERKRTEEKISRKERKAKTAEARKARALGKKNRQGRSG